MRCADVRPILSFFLEKETGPAETLETRRHLDACRACRSRAEHLSAVSTACASIREVAPATDLASSVMSRLRELRAASGMKGGMTAARWSGLSVILGSILALMTRRDGHALSALFHPFDYLATLLAGTDAASSSEGAGRAAAALAMAVAGGGGGSDLTAGAGVDLLLTVQLVATGLLIGLLLALPVAVLTAWFLKDGLADRQIPRL